MKSMILFLSILLTSCSSIAVSFTPTEVKQSVVDATAIANIAEKNPPTGEDLILYLQLNAEMWRSLADFYGLLK